MFHEDGAGKRVIGTRTVSGEIMPSKDTAEETGGEGGRGGMEREPWRLMEGVLIEFQVRMNLETRVSCCALIELHSLPNPKCLREHLQNKLGVTLSV
jgi:hypothetical protein